MAPFIRDSGVRVLQAYNPVHEYYAGDELVKNFMLFGVKPHR